MVALALVLVGKMNRLFGVDRGTESQILAEASAQLAKEERFKNLTVEVDGRTVKLRGTVVLLEDKRQAMLRVRELKGAKIFVNHIKVKTQQIPDASLQAELKASLTGSQNGQIRVKVKRGVVTIQGAVQHDANREEVLSTIASTVGVVGMKDRMQVAVDGTREGN